MNFIEGRISGIVRHAEIEICEIRHQPGVNRVVGRKPGQNLISLLRERGIGLVGAGKLFFRLVAPPADINLLIVLVGEFLRAAL